MATGDLLIPYGLRDGQLVHIDQLTEAQRGMKCNCFCPDENCGKPLVARMGKVRTKYFAHAHQSLSCSEMTVLHTVAQRLLFERIEKAMSQGEEIIAEWMSGATQMQPGRAT